MQPRFDFAAFYQNDKLSDCSLLIRIDGDVKQRLPGHGIVLSNVSHVFRDEIEQQQGLGGRPSIHLDVRPDQVRAACALVRFVYTGDLPDPTSGQQCLLVHMLHLAHTFGVTDLQTACYNALMSCHQLQPDALGLAYMLLAPLTDTTATGPVATAAAAHATGARAGTGAGAGAAATPGFGALLHHCLDQLQQQLGDMEAVLSCPIQLAQVSSLPLPALLALLRDERTAAVSENTVLAVVHNWMAAAAQRDVRVDAVQREQLAGAVRVPLLEPCYLGTVLPRMAWLLEILGPQGLAMVAGVARGLCDPHAEPVLGNPRACGTLAAGWLQGPRPVPASCSRAMHGGPALTINWLLSLSDIRTAFEAACAEADAKALLAQQQQKAAAAAATAAAHPVAPVSSEVPVWGLGLRSPMAAASAAAAMGAAMNVASVAAAAAARVFKRKRSFSAASFDEGGRDQQSSSTAAVVGAGQTHLMHDQELEQGCGGAEEQQQQQEEGKENEPGLQHMQPGSQAGKPLSQQPRLESVPNQAADGQGDAEDLPPMRKRRRRAAAAAPTELATEEAGTAGCAGQTAAAAAAREGVAAARPSSGQAARRHTQPLSPSGAAAAAADAAAGFFSQEPLPAAPAPAAAAVASPVGARTSISSEAQQLPRQFKLRSPEAQFAGYNWRLVLYFQPRDATSSAAAAGASAGAGGCLAGTQQGGDSGGIVRGAARQAVTAAHAVRLPDEAVGSAAAAGAAAAAGTAAGVTTGCLWTARLAIEARPAVTLQPGATSTVAFSGNLAVRLSDSSTDTAGAAAAGSGRQRQGRSRAAAASPRGERAGRAPGGCLSPLDAAPSPGRRQNMPPLGSPARYAVCPEAAAAAAAAAAEAAAAAAPAAVRQHGGRARSPAGKQQAAAAATGCSHRGLHAAGGLMSIPESDAEEGSGDSGSQPSSSSDDDYDGDKEAGIEAPSAVEDSDLDEEGFAMVGEYPSALHAGGGAGTAAAAAAGGGTPKSRGRRRQQQQPAQQGGRGAGRRPASAGSAGEQQQAAAVTQGGPVAAAGVGGDDGEQGKWRVLQLPQGSWLRSRACDTGFTSFFSISLQQGVWDEAAWEQYLQPGGVLQLRGNIWNVR